uniref:BHLH domain-containing protein n=1 Tax=Panagrellus redivivus TaxID=6233 RepID=A0A7E4UQT6_PANRE
MDSRTFFYPEGPMCGYATKRQLKLEHSNADDFLKLEQSRRRYRKLVRLLEANVMSSYPQPNNQSILLTDQ